VGWMKKGGLDMAGRQKDYIFRIFKERVRNQKYKKTF
jgi:hypothetical protein